MSEVKEGATLSPMTAPARLGPGRWDANGGRRYPRLAARLTTNATRCLGVKVDNCWTNVDNMHHEGCQYRLSYMRDNMTSVRGRSEQIRRFILDEVPRHPHEIQKVVSQRFGITRQAVNKHLHSLVREKALLAEGQTRNRIYRLAPLAKWSKAYVLDPSLAAECKRRGLAFLSKPFDVKELREALAKAVPAGM